MFYPVHAYMESEKIIGMLIIVVGALGVLMSLAMIVTLPGMVAKPLKATLSDTAGDIDNLASKVGGYENKIVQLSGEFKGSLDELSDKVTTTADTGKKNLNELESTLGDAEGTLNSFGGDLDKISGSMGSIGTQFKAITLIPQAASIGSEFETAGKQFAGAKENTVNIAAQLKTSSETLAETAETFETIKEITGTVDDVGGNIDSLASETASTLGTVEDLLKDTSTSLKTADVSGVGVPFQALGVTLLFIFLVILSIGFNYIKDVERSSKAIAEIKRLEARISALESQIESKPVETAPLVKEEVAEEEDEEDNEE